MTLPIPGYPMDSFTQLAVRAALRAADEYCANCSGLCGLRMGL